MNYKKPESNFLLEIRGQRHGAGAGASGSWVCVVVTGIYDPKDLNTIELGGLDFSLSLGGKWSGMIKNLRAATKIRPIINAARAGKWTGSIAELLASAEQLKKAVVMAFSDPESTQVDVKVIDVVGTGLESGLYYTVSKFRATAIHWS